MSEIPKLTTKLDPEAFKDPEAVRYLVAGIKSPLDEPVSCPHCFHTFIIAPRSTDD